MNSQIQHINEAIGKTEKKIIEILDDNLNQQELKVKRILKDRLGGHVDVYASLVKINFLLNYC